MPMTVGSRKLALTAHVTSSVGWLGAVAGFLALAVAGLASRDAQLVRAAYLAMELVGWFVIVPLALATLPTGLVLSLGTEWGVFRHWWVLAKVMITVPATVLLLVHMRPVGHVARVVAETTLAHGQLAGLRMQLVADAGAAMLVLLVATALSIYKPRGMTAYGRRMQQAQLGTATAPSVAAPARWVRALWIVAGVGVLLFVGLHLAGGGMHGH
jgi:hypothetical protein